MQLSKIVQLLLHLENLPKNKRDIMTILAFSRYVNCWDAFLMKH